MQTNWHVLLKWVHLWLFRDVSSFLFFRYCLSGMRYFTELNLIRVISNWPRVRVVWARYIEIFITSERQYRKNKKLNTSRNSQRWTRFNEMLQLLRISEICSSPLVTTSTNYGFRNAFWSQTREKCTRLAKDRMFEKPTFRWRFHLLLQTEV